MELKNRPKIAAYVVVGFVVALLFLFSIKVPGVLARVLGALPLIVAVLFAVFDRWAWRWPWILPFVHRPRMRGTWRGTLKSYRRDAESDEKITSEHDVVLSIEQTFTSVSVTLMTRESKSISISSEMVRRESGSFVLFYLYDNTPKLEYRQSSSRIHRGGCAIDIPKYDPDILEGEYWTDRETLGSFSLSFVSAKPVNSFRDGLQEGAESE